MYWREVTDALGQHAEHRDARLGPPLDVDGMRVRRQIDAADGHLAVAELADPAAVVELREQLRCRAGDPWLFEMPSDHDVDIFHIRLLERC